MIDIAAERKRINDGMYGAYNLVATANLNQYEECVRKLEENYYQNTSALQQHLVDAGVKNEPVKGIV